MKKKSLAVIAVTTLIFVSLLSCKKDKQAPKEPLCSWFPVITGTSLKYEFSQQEGYTEPFPTSIKSYATTDTSLSIYKLLFVFRDCGSGKLLFDHGPSDERIVLFDKNRPGTNIQITDTIFHNIRHFVTQTSAADGTLTSVLKEDIHAHEELIASFKPGVGITYVAAINTTTGGIIYAETLQQ